MGHVIPASPPRCDDDDTESPFTRWMHWRVVRRGHSQVVAISIDAGTSSFGVWGARSFAIRDALIRSRHRAAHPDVNKTQRFPDCEIQIGSIHCNLSVESRTGKGCYDREKRHQRAAGTAAFRSRRSNQSSSTRQFIPYPDIRIPDISQSPSIDRGLVRDCPAHLYSPANTRHEHDGTSTASTLSSASRRSWNASTNLAQYAK